MPNFYQKSIFIHANLIALLYHQKLMIMIRFTYILILAFFSLVQSADVAGQCVIEGVEATAGDCLNGQFMITIDFEYDGVGNEGFNIQGNGTNYGNFGYGDVPVTIGPLDGDGITEYEFVVTDNQNGDCSDFDELGIVSCPGNGCEIYDFVADPGDCNADGTYQLWLNFNYQNAPNEHFDVFYAGNIIGTYNLSDLPIVIEHFQDNGEDFPEIKVCFNDTPDCCAETEFEAPNCNSSDCSISDLVVEAGDCNADGSYHLWLNFNYDNSPNEFFDVYYEGQSIGFFALADLPVVIEHFEDNGEPEQVINVCINDTPDCCAEAIFESPDCVPCSIWDLSASASDCEAGTFFVTLNFEHEGTNGDGFSVHGNGIDYGIYEYGALPITIGPLVGDSTTQYEFGVADAAYPDCSAAVELGLVDCDQTGDCGIFNAVAYPLECNDDSTYNVYVSFDVEFPGSNFFTVTYLGDTIVEHAAIANLPFVIENFEDNDSASQLMVICIDGSPNCCEEVEFETPVCPPPCDIWDLSVTASDCEAGMFFVTLTFEHENTGDDGFSVHGNGIDYGIYEYGALPLTIGPLVGDSTTQYEFAIADVSHPDCSVVVELGIVDCGQSGDCIIYDAVAHPIECHDDGTYDVAVNFGMEFPGSNFFTVSYFGDTIVEHAAIANLPYLIEHFVDNDSAAQALTICLDGSPDCCAEVEFEAPECPLPCNIWDLNVTASDCEAGMFYVTLNFEYENTGDQGFKVLGNGIFYGVFDYGELPLTLGPLVGDSTTQYEFAVKDVAHPDCHFAVEFGVVDCDQSGDCDIYEAVADPLECYSDGTYDVAIDFGVIFPGNNFFNVIYQGDVIVNHAPISNLPYIIEHFEDNGNSNPVLIICINDSQDCCAEVPFEAPDCPATDCHIYDVIAEAHDCNSDGQFLVDIAFEYQNTGSQGFTILGNGTNYGTFDYGEPFYTIGPLAGNGTIYEFIVKDIEFGDCHGFTTLGPVYCDTDCHIYDLVADLSDCDADGQFFVTLDFEYENVGNDGFKVHGNGNVYGVFNYDELPVTIGPFSGNGGELEFVVSDFNNPDCHDYIEIDAPDCNGSGDCHIYDLTANVHPCLPNGTFFVSLDFAHTGTSDYFKVMGNGVEYGVFSYADVPVSIGPLVGNGSTPYGFLVQDIHFPDCAEDVFVGPVDCGPTGDCNVFNVVADPGVCDDDGSYNLWVNFEFENASNNYFDLFHNGDLVDYFPLSSIPVVVPHIYENGDSIQTVTICINDSPGCCDSTTYATPDCNIGNLVWPGDANADNIVNNFDLLHLGVGYGTDGPPRVIQGIEWTGLDATDWGHVFLSNLNYKHADCNGDGIINAGDMGAIFLNYGESHDSITPAPLIGGIETDPPVYVDLPEADVLLNGLPFTAPIILGTEPLPVQNAYGIAFTLHFDPLVIDPASVSIQYDPSWLGVQNVNLLTFDHSQAAEGIIEVALVRTDGNSVSGFGEVAGFIGIIDNIAGKEAATIEITDVKAISENEKLIPLYRQAEIVDLVTGTKETEQHVIKVYPNPAGQYVIISHPDGLVIESVQLKDLNGKALNTKNMINNQLDISGLPAGVYTLHIRAGETNFVNRIVKL